METPYAVTVSLLSAHHALIPVRTLKILCPPFRKRKFNGRWLGNTQITRNSGRIFQMMVVATLKMEEEERREE